MTDNPAAAIPAGWYPDASTPGQVRWWDGAAWTEHVAAGSGTAAPAAVAARPLLPADRPVYSPFIWVIALLPLISYAALFSWRPEFRYLPSSGDLPAQIDPLSIYSAGYFVIVALSLVLYGLSALLAYRDVVWLKRQGVVRPFHWAFAFIGGIVYLIGRSVIVRRVAAPHGLAPIWATIVVYVVGIIVSSIWTAALVSSMVTLTGTLHG